MCSFLEETATCRKRIRFPVPRSLLPSSVRWRKTGSRGESSSPVLLWDRWASSSTSPPARTGPAAHRGERLETHPVTIPNPSPCQDARRRLNLCPSARERSRSPMDRTMVSEAVGGGSIPPGTTTRCVSSSSSKSFAGYLEEGHFPLRSAGLVGWGLISELLEGSTGR